MVRLKMARFCVNYFNLMACLMGFSPGETSFQGLKVLEWILKSKNVGQ